MGTRTGEVIHEFSVRADPVGYQRALESVSALGLGARCRALGGCGAYGAGLARHLIIPGEQVIEVDRPGRTGTRSGAKSDALDAVRAARYALSRTHPTIPRADGPREVLRVLTAAREGATGTRRRAICQPKGLLVSAPDCLREPLRHLTTTALLGRCAALRPSAHADPVIGATASALWAIARRALAATKEAKEHERAIATQVAQMVPALPAELGVGPITRLR